VDARPADAELRARELIRGVLADQYADRVTARNVVRAGVWTVEVEVRAEVPALGLFGPSVPLLVRGHAVKEVVP